MMDLLVQATTSNKIAPGGHIINVISKDERSVSYKPSTPIGSLDANTVYIVPKATLDLPIKRMPKLANQPFEQQTFRLQVNLPHNQRMVLRVSPRTTLAELKSQICSEKELDQSSHHLVRPAQPDTVLDLNATLEVYGCAEISLMSSAGLQDSIRSTNIFPYTRAEEEKKKKGILRLFSRRRRGDVNIAIEKPANGTSTLTHSQSESTGLNRHSYQPKQSLKRKPAPAPPQNRNSSPPFITQSSNSINSRPESEISIKTADEVESSVSHSRHSSDSSGYHEPSVFSDCSENKSPEASIVHGDHVSVNDANRQESPFHKDYPDSCVLMKRSSMTAKDTNLKNVPSCSNVSIISTSRKRKAPQPPVSTLPAIESPSSPDAPPLETIENMPSNVSSKNTEHEVGEIHPQNNEDALPNPRDNDTVESKGSRSDDAVQQESEALQYLEDVLHESESSAKDFLPHKALDDSDTDSQRDEGEMISVCLAEIHANNNDQDSPDSVVEPHAVVSPDLPSPKSSTAPLSLPNSQPAGCEVVDISAEDSGISQSLFSDADSSVPSIESDFKTMSDSGCQEEIYCNVAGGVISSFSSPVIYSRRPTPGIETVTAPIPLPRMSLKRKGVTSVESLNSSTYPSCDSSKSVPSNSDVQSHNKEGLDSYENGVLGSNISDLKPVGVQTDHEQPSSGESSNNSKQEIRVDESTITNKEDSQSLKTISKADPIITSKVDEESPESKCKESRKSSFASDSKSSSLTSESKESRSSSVASESPLGSISSTPRNRKKLENFALGCYKKEDNVDIYSLPSPESENKPQEKSQSQINPVDLKKELEIPVRRVKNQPDVKIVSFKEQKEQNEEYLQQSSSGRVLEKCAQLSSISTLPLTGRSASLFNLTPQKKIEASVKEQTLNEEVMNEGMKRAQSDQNFATDLEVADIKTNLLQEQKRLQDEYKRLQEQFMSWQKQLLYNQNVLQTEKIVPQMDFPAFESLGNLEMSSIKANSEKQVYQSEVEKNRFDELKTRSLPRPKTKPLSLKEAARPKTPPIPQSPTETAVVDIDISVSETAKRPESLHSHSVNTQVNVDLKDKVVQVPPPQDKVVQVPSPQDKVTSSTQVPSPENVDGKEDVSAQTSIKGQESSPEISSYSPSTPSPDNESSKSQTLPRPKPKPISAFQPSQTMTLNRSTQPKSQVVSVTIGSWQQRNSEKPDIEPYSVASSRSKFQSLESIPQNSNKLIPNTIEKRKLPPVPTESVNIDNESVPLVHKPVEPVSDNAVISKSIKEHANVPSKTKDKVQEEHKSTVISQEKSKISNAPRPPKLVPKQSETETQKQKNEIKFASKDPSAMFKSSKPFVKLSSMKDETHTTSIIGLKKWPLSEGNSITDGRQTILEDLRANSKRPGGYVQDKIRRAEVDLRKPKSSKTESVTIRNSKDSDVEPSKLHITKVNVNNTNSGVNSNTVVKNVSSTTNTVTPVNLPVQKSTASNAVTSVTATTSRHWSNTIPKSQSLNSELMSVFSKKASKNLYSEINKQNIAPKHASTASETVTVNGSSPAPPPPPPPQPSLFTMPVIPPAEQIPVSSQLLMARGTKTLPVTKKESKKSPSKPSQSSDPREELMLEIRGFGGKQALRKVPVAQTGWNLKVFGTASTANT
ncbi:cordon-bleu protein-like 1 isoform X2 [Stegodyphus dumicola]|uniref:cordon-bleu protein-like 1 isoform X2 n=1 Tax=Stegodyphus dumicola TaxID=202533 RepID=UPI0015AF748D|nr:cordon-bleu protein-like 1 isoform X2 [Stegodyphus dumicola]